jgi:hypothetical protein
MGDQSFPFDACSEPEQTVTSITEGGDKEGEHIYLSDLPTLEQPRFPKYNVRSLIHKLDERLCERLGMPRYLPVSFCMMQQPTAISIAQGSFVEQAANLLQGDLSQRGILGQNQIIMDSLIQRVITTMYSEFGYQHHQMLEAILSSVVNHYDAISKTKFPETMCSTLLPENGSFCSQLVK